MDISTIIGTFANALIAAAAAATAALAAYGIRRLAEYLKNRTTSADAKRFIDEASDAISAAVAATSQTYADALKAARNFHQGEPGKGRRGRPGDRQEPSRKGRRRLHRRRIREPGRLPEAQNRSRGPQPEGSPACRQDDQGHGGDHRRRRYYCRRNCGRRGQAGHHAAA